MTKHVECISQTCNGCPLESDELALIAERVDRERRYRSNPDYFGQARDYTGDEGYQMSRMFDDGLGYDVIPEEPSNVSDGSDRSVGSVASTNSDIGQPLNRQLDFDGGNKRKPKKKTKKKRKYLVYIYYENRCNAQMLNCFCFGIYGCKDEWCRGRKREKTDGPAGALGQTRHDSRRCG